MSSFCPACQKIPPGARTYCSRACYRAYHQQQYRSSDFFWQRVKIGDSTECWPWEKGRDGHGYGAVWNGTRLIKTHRRAYELAHGPIPEGMLVCHTCDNPPCCNPAHLWIGTTYQNAMDREKKKRGDNSGKHLIRWKQEHPERILRGKQCTWAKLTEDQVLEIYQHKGLLTVDAAAEKFQVNRITLHDIWARRTWRHLTMEQPEEYRK